MGDTKKYTVTIEMSVELEAFDEEDAIDRAKEKAFLDEANIYVKDASFETREHLKLHETNVAKSIMCYETQLMYYQIIDGEKVLVEGEISYEGHDEDDTYWCVKHDAEVNKDEILNHIDCK